MFLAKQLKFHREQVGLSQTRLAEKLNISRQSVSKWENGRGYPDIDNLILLSQLYDITIDDLLKENKLQANWDVQGNDERPSYFQGNYYSNSCSRLIHQSYPF